MVDAEGQRLQVSKLPNDLELIKKALTPFAGKLQGIVVESTYNWYWLVDGLQEAGYKVHLANPTAIEPYSGLKHSDDASDTWWLAELLRLKLLKEGYVYPRAERAVRDLLRKRAHLVQQRTQNLLSVQNLTCRNTGSSLRSNQVKKLTTEGLEQSYGKEEDRALAINCSLRIIGALGLFFVLVGLFIGRPFLERKAVPISLEDRQVSSLLAERDRILNALQELDFDFTLGKIPELEYPGQRSMLLQRGADILRQLDSLRPENSQEDAEMRLEAVIAARRADLRMAPNGGSGRVLYTPDDDLETVIANRRRQHKEKTGGFCPQCGRPVQKSDRFCPKCGAILD